MSGDETQDSSDVEEHVCADESANVRVHVTDVEQLPESVQPSKRQKVASVDCVKLGAANPDTPTGFMFKALFGGRPCTILMDSGADRCYVDAEWLRRAHLSKTVKCKLQRFPLSTPMVVLTASSAEVPVSQACAGVLHLESMHIPVPRAHVMENLLHGVDLILGMDWLTQQDVDLKCGSNVVQITHNNRRRILYPVVRDKHVAQPGVAAVRQAGELPMLTAKMAARALRKGC